MPFPSRLMNFSHLLYTAKYITCIINLKSTVYWPCTENVVFSKRGFNFYFLRKKKIKKEKS